MLEPLQSSFTNKCIIYYTRKDYKIYVKISFDYALTCFGLRPSSGSLHWSLAKIMIKLRLSKHFVVICYAVVWQHAATPPHNI